MKTVGNLEILDIYQVEILSNYHPGNTFWHLFQRMAIFQKWIGSLSPFQKPLDFWHLSAGLRVKSEVEPYTSYLLHSSEISTLCVFKTCLLVWRKLSRVWNFQIDWFEIYAQELRGLNHLGRLLGQLLLFGDWNIKNERLNWPTNKKW